MTQKTYKVGDSVFVGTVERSLNQVCCPDCLGTLKWLVVFADDSSAEVACQTCKKGFEPPCGKIDIGLWSPRVRKMTIGSVRSDSAEKEGRQLSYMCVETGVGSGNVYYADDISDDELSAKKRADEKCEEHMRATAENNFSKKFGGTKELESALSTWGFSRAEQVRKAQEFRKWARISKILQ